MNSLPFCWVQQDAILRQCILFRVHLLSYNFLMYANPKTKFFHQRPLKQEIDHQVRNLNRMHILHLYAL
jgi:hypothetical protein